MPREERQRWVADVLGRLPAPEPQKTEPRKKEFRRDPPPLKIDDDVSKVRGVTNSNRQKLRRILGLEREQGFEDRVVIGGLDGFLDRQSSELSSIIGSPPNYSSMPREERQRWVADVLGRLPAPEPQKTEPRKAEPRKKEFRRDPPPLPPLKIDDDVSKVPGVTNSNRQKLQRLGLETVRDLLSHFPIRRKDFSDIRQIEDLESGKEQTVLGTIKEISRVEFRSKKGSSAHAVLSDSTGRVWVTWFGKGFLAEKFPPGTKLSVSGEVGAFGSNLKFENPEYDEYETLRGQGDLVHTGRIVPVYSLVEGLYQRTLRSIIGHIILNRVRDACLQQLEEYLPEDVLHRNGLLGIESAFSQIHYPDSFGAAEAARQRLAFDELFLLQMAVLRRRQAWQELGDGIALDVGLPALDAFVDSLPFSFTDAQKRATDEILSDIQTARPMNRMLEGDVGSGKTVVAAVAMLAAVLNGYQAAILAPTEILAEQHFLTITRLLRGEGSKDGSQYIANIQLGEREVTVGLLLGSLSKRVKDDTRLMLAAGQIDIVIGTHALIQESVDIPKLALAVVDELHRFGVMQRFALRSRGTRPHMLVMSATPIPRSLALTVYGELDVSIIDEMPAGRPQIVTRYERPERRGVVYKFVRSQVEAGRQAFMVVPFIEESEIKVGGPIRDKGGQARLTEVEQERRTKFVRGAVNEYERLSKEVFPELRLGLLHGLMSLREKEEVMDKFQGGELDILVSTPVVEVGIDVPNATVMVIDGADRFGLAQLHQFRGRVGRGRHESYCILLADEPGKSALKRLKLIENFRDGFKLADKDLELRGAGDYLGTRQSGVPDLKVAKLTDQETAKRSRSECENILRLDPGLVKEQHRKLAKRLAEYEKTVTAEMS